MFTIPIRLISLAPTGRCPILPDARGNRIGRARRHPRLRRPHPEGLLAGARTSPIAANDLDPAITAAIPTVSSPGQGMPPVSSFTRVRDLGQEIEQVPDAGSIRHRGRCRERAGVLEAGNG